MTEYGRGSGPEPWHPEDPSYGNRGWEGQQADGRQQTPYGTQQDPYQQPYGTQQYQAPDHSVPDHRAQQHDNRNHGDQGHGGQGHGDRDHGGQEYGGRDHGDQGHVGHDYGGQPYDGWDTGQQAAMPYGAPPAPAAPYDGHAPDPYGTPEAYPPPQPPGLRRAEAEPVPVPEAPEEDHPVLPGGNGPEPPPRTRRGAREGRGKPKKKSRNGIACLFVAAVLVGGAGGIAYFGYQFWQNQFGAAPDYEGAGTDETVEIVVPKGAGGYEIAAILVENGVVKSQGAFVSAQERNPKGDSIQDGVYTLNKGMSAENAVKALLNPSNRNSFTVPEGRRNAWVYEQIDKRLGLAPGITRKVAEEQADKLGLPEWATGHPQVKDPLEGFLFPASYPIAKGSKPEDILRKMVARANTEYGKLNLETKAKSLGLKGPWELITVASLVQAEGKTDDDFRKMSEVVYNRLKPTNTETYQLLQFDSTFNYLKGQSEIKISEKEVNGNRDPYNTYTQKGLTPGPIGNPGTAALNAAMNPTHDGWLYFVATDGKHKTEFAKTHAEFLKLKEKFDASQANN